MKITLLNGSPRLNNSTTKKLLSYIKSNIEAKSTDSTFTEITWKDSSIPEDTDILIIGSPLYYDSLPGFFLGFLENYITTKPHKEMKVYGLINCGFYEGTQNKTGLMIMESFAEEAGFSWCGGLGIGGGGLFPAFEYIPDFTPIKKPVLKALEDFSENIRLNKTMVNTYTQPNCTWTLYKLGGEASWKQNAKANGLTTKDLYATPLLD